MKKYLCTVLAALLALVSLVGCGGSASAPEYNSAKDGEWFEIQSITYYLNNSTYQYSAEEYTLTSKYIWEVGDTENIEKEEYIAAKKDQEIISFSSGAIGINRKDSIKNPTKYIGKYYYFTSYGYPEDIYYKKQLLSCNIYYVKIRFLENENIELNYCEYNIKDIFSDFNNKTIRIKPLAYSITYFSD